MPAHFAPHSIRLAILAGAFAPAAAAAAPRDLPLTPLAWSLLGGIALLAVVVAAVSLWRARGLRAQDDGPLGRYLGPTDEPAHAAAPAVELPAAIRTRATGAPLGAQLRPQPLLPVDAERLPVAGDPDVELARIVEIARAASAGADAPHAAADAADSAPEGAPPFLALQHVDLSIDVLRRHLAAEARPMPAVWVMLLDLCRTHAREQAFREIAAEFHHRFNVRTPAWDRYPPERGEPGLEAYPRIVRDLTQTWGTRECVRLLDRLLYDNRSGDRRGFTMTAYNDLIALRRAAGVVQETIAQDSVEESKVRGAYREAASAARADEPFAQPVADAALVRDLERKLDADLTERAQARAAPEHEHPALADALAREWGNAALASCLGEMLARGTEAAGRSVEAKGEPEALRGMAQRLAEVNRIKLATD